MSKVRSLKELRSVIDFKLSSPELIFSKVKNLGKLDLDMDVYLETIGRNLQRGNVWSVDQKRELIISVFHERYIPPVRVMSLINEQDEEKDIKQIIDGKQRLTTFMEFTTNEFFIRLDGTLFYYTDLPKDYKFAIDNYYILCQTAYDDYDEKFTDEDKINWFNQINFAGTPQDFIHMENLKKGLQKAKEKS